MNHKGEVFFVFPKAVNNEFIKLARAYRSLKSISDVYANKLYALNPSKKEMIQMLLDKALKK